MAGVRSGGASGNGAASRVWMRYGGHGALAPCRVTGDAGCYAVRLAMESVLGSGILVGHGTHDYRGGVWRTDRSVCTHMCVWLWTPGHASVGHYPGTGATNRCHEPGTRSHNFGLDQWIADGRSE
jgi:hypothetical protein